MPQPKHARGTDAATETGHPEERDIFDGGENMLGCGVWDVGRREGFQGGEGSGEDYEAREKDPCAGVREGGVVLC
ncbi:hypothetical protein NHQ30_004190 [Ciborinia camelliae]|nr:hypothetical protein NHQ30_004190 [Ciborinia camelliae]